MKQVAIILRWLAVASLVGASSCTSTLHPRSDTDAETPIEDAGRFAGGRGDAEEQEPSDAGRNSEPDAGRNDAAAPDGGSTEIDDAGLITTDAGTLGEQEAGAPDAGVVETPVLDAGAPDAGSPNQADLGLIDLVNADAGEAVSFPDAETFAVPAPQVHAKTRIPLVNGMADPDVLVDDSIYLVGTWEALTLPIYRLDGGQMVLHKRFDPSLADPDFTYCDVWAPELNRLAPDLFFIAFAAKRVPVGQSCGGNDSVDQTIFWATAPSTAFEFGPPVLVDLGPDAPGSVEARACPAAGCDRAMRIDVSVFDDKGAFWVLYTWFQDGNHNAMVSLSNPTVVIHNTDPLNADEEHVNEAPEIFERNGTYYYLYSAGGFLGAYRLMYFMADSVAGLRRDQAEVHQLTFPKFARDGTLLENAGHGTIVSVGDAYYAVYHVGRMQGGNLTGRDTIASPITFLPTGEMRLLGAVELTWDPEPGAISSLDVVKTDGTLIGPCIDASRIGSARSVRFEGVCNDNIVPLSDVATFRLCTTTDNWVTATCVDRPNPQVSDRLHLSPDPSARFLQAEHSGRCLDLANFNTDEQGAVIQRECLGAVNQQWEVTPSGEAVSLRSTHSGKCLTPANGSAELGANLVQATCNDDSSQQWEFIPFGQRQAVRNVKSGLCIDIASWSQDDGAAVIHGHCTGGENQRFLRR